MTKILLVEDDKSLREIYGVRLLAEGYDIVSAGDGEEALAMAIKDRPALIVSDVMMPKISGFDMLDILRSTTETRDIKVIMMTALSSEDQRKRGEQLGADRYLVKSQVGIEDVVRTVHEVLADAPVAQPTVGAIPGPAPATSSAPRPINVPPARSTDGMTAAPTPQPVQDQAPPVQAPVAAPQPQVQTAPVFNPAPQTPPPAPGSQAFSLSQPTPQPTAPQGSGLPQPTAPFSTPRPGSTDRIIEPISKPETNEPHVGDLMDQALSRESADEVALNEALSNAQDQPSTPAPTPEPAMSTPPSGLNFEETPRTETPPAPTPPVPPFPPRSDNAS